MTYRCVYCTQFVIELLEIPKRGIVKLISFLLLVHTYLKVGTTAPFIKNNELNSRL